MEWGAQFGEEKPLFSKFARSNCQYLYLIYTHSLCIFNKITENLEVSENTSKHTRTHTQPDKRPRQETRKRWKANKNMIEWNLLCGIGKSLRLPFYSSCADYL